MYKPDVTDAITEADRIIAAKLRGFSPDSRLEDLKKRWSDLIDNCEDRIDANKVRDYHPVHITSGGNSLKNSSNVDDFLKKYEKLEEYIIKNLY